TVGSSTTLLPVPPVICCGRRAPLRSRSLSATSPCSTVVDASSSHCDSTVVFSSSWNFAFGSTCADTRCGPPGLGARPIEGIVRRARRVTRDRALDYLLGLTCINDVTVRDLQKKDGQWARAKGFDTFCPLGPRIVSGLDPSALRITTRVDGQVRQDSSTSDL